ncbi:MAG TPA: ATP-binding protein, partial [Candidatus Limnocylindria bacterium]
IANALDEQVLTRTADPEIAKGQDGWHVRDFGRGIQIQHFTQNENPEKLASAGGVIGKFGVGLKDALATFHRNGITVTVRSRFGTYRLKTAAKTGFGDIKTLHVEYDDTPNAMVGSDVSLAGVSDESVRAAQSLFLRYSGELPIESSVDARGHDATLGAAPVGPASSCWISTW